VHNKHIGRHNHVHVLIHFLPIFDRLVRNAGAADTPPPPPEIIGAAASRICHGAPARQPDLTAASRISDGGAAEGSTGCKASCIKHRRHF